MTLIEALKLSEYVRRTGNPKHLYEDGTPRWLDTETLLGTANKTSPFLYMSAFCLTKEDLMANDWVAKGKDYDKQE
jgi:hypothetical protein